MLRYRKGALPLFSAGLVLFFAGIIVVKEKPVLNARLIDKNTTRVTDSLYAYKYETSNREYKTFLNTLRTTDTGMYFKCYPDTLAWRSIRTYCDPIVEYYHLHPGFDNFPAVNISYEGAIEYCKWLTTLYNNDPKRKFRKVLFTLPSIAEWVLAAKGGRKDALYPWGSYYLRDKQGRFLANFKHADETSVVSDKNGQPVFSDSIVNAVTGLNDRAFYTADVNSFYPNDFGLFNISGNVAEMTLEKGTAKGGSFNSYGGEIRIASSQRYDDPSPELGFRVFMKVTER